MASRAPSQLAARVRAGLTQVGGSPESTVVHVHNHALGKNGSLLGRLPNWPARLAAAAANLHDFAEDFRPLDYQRLRAGASGKADGDWRPRPTRRRGTSTMPCSTAATRGSWRGGRRTGARPRPAQPGRRAGTAASREPARRAGRSVSACSKTGRCCSIRSAASGERISAKPCSGRRRWPAARGTSA